MPALWVQEIKGLGYEFRLARISEILEFAKNVTELRETDPLTGKKIKEEKEMFYRFNVLDPKEIDLKRILDENPDQDVLLVTVGNSGLLVVRTRFLKQFRGVDKLMLGSGSVIALCPDWGWAQTPSYAKDGWMSDDKPILDRKERFWLVSASETPKLVAQVRAAREHLAKKITVKVAAL